MCRYNKLRLDMLYNAEYMFAVEQRNNAVQPQRGDFIVGPGVLPI